MKSLYFIAVLPPEPILTEIRQMKLDVRDRFGSARALRSPAHITLVPPFHADDSSLEQVHEVLAGVAKRTSSFVVELDGFDCFRPSTVCAAGPRPVNGSRAGSIR